MRSSKSRSRNKNNNRRSVGNVVNRVFDSSGPEGKVRGTPQQIIDKYLTLARDAQLANDRVAVENFQQHAEHYTRMLGEAMREQEARREQQDQQQQNQQKQRNDRQDRGDRNDQNDRNDRGQSGDQARTDPADAPQPETGQGKPAEAQSAETTSSDVIDLGGNDGDTGLVETPESKPARKPRSRSRRKKSDDTGSETEKASETSSEKPAAE